MTDAFEYNPGCESHRWVGCFDFLGTRDLIRSRDSLSVFCIYERAVREMQHAVRRLPKIHVAWFSDTFLLYSQNDSASDFAAIDLGARWFAHFLLLAKIPIRGAIACGELYADAESNVYFGPALVEAFELAEATDWIGLILCPSAVTRLAAVGLPAEERLHYAFAKIPFKKSVGIERLPACLLGEWCKINNQNQVLAALQGMAQKQRNKSIRRKYENAIAFIRTHRRSAFIGRDSAG